MIFKNILMCKPTYFDVKHFLLNDHMTMIKDVDKWKAGFQWKKLRSTLHNNGVNLEFIEPKNRLVDMVFSANGGLIYKNKALVSKFSAEPREREQKEYFNYFTNNGYDVYNMHNYFEGAGDALFSHNKKHLWIGYGFRSSLASMFEINNILNDENIDIHSLQLVDGRWYHLDTCFCPIGKDSLLLYENAFTPKSLTKIYSVYDENKVIKVTAEDAINFACNSICIPSITNSATIIGHKFSKELKYNLFDRDFNVIENDMSEFLLSGGSTKCCVLSIDKD